MQNNDKYDLSLPEAADFVSEPPRYTVIEMMLLCEKMLPYWNKQRFSKELPKFTGEEFRFL